ncbi:hypothetical protein [Shimia sp.]|uniref:hypothetical protein n=1 Tax=Shimia sp. TaxID=1954381 RepID=UPI003297F241
MTAFLVLSSIPAWSDSGVVLEPVQDSKMASILVENFTLPMLLDAPSLADKDLSIEIDAEVRKLENLMKSYGYLDAQVEVHGEINGYTPLKIEPKPGQQYRIGWVQVIGLPGDETTVLFQTLQDISENFVGNVASGKALRTLQNRIIHEMREASFAWVKQVHTDIVPEPATLTAGYRLRVDPGAAMVFGDVRFTGSVWLTDIEARSIVPFKSGDPFSQTALDTLYTALEESGMFRRISISLSNELNAAGHLVVLVDLGDNANDQAAGVEGQGMSPALIIFAIIMLALREAARLTPLWNSKTLRWGLALCVFVSISIALAMVAQRFISFLPM